jgi:3-methyladenine DNA glycosylase AlkD
VKREDNRVVSHADVLERGASNARKTLRVCRLLLPDADDMVVKAMSWALRELGKRDPKRVAAFVRKEDGRLTEPSNLKGRSRSTVTILVGLETLRPALALRSRG